MAHRAFDFSTKMSCELAVKRWERHLTLARSYADSLTKITEDYPTFSEDYRRMPTIFRNFDLYLFYIFFFIYFLFYFFFIFLLFCYLFYILLIYYYYFFFFAARSSQLTEFSSQNPRAAVSAHGFKNEVYSCV